MKFDLLVLGAGISGLTHAYKYLKKHPSKSVCIIEKSNEIGGRVRQELFNGVLVPTGAGIGRKEKDKKLLELMKQLDLEPVFYTHTVEYHDRIKKVDTAEIIGMLKTTLEKSINKPEITCMNFAQFATSHLGADLYEAFLDTVGYTDFENLDAKDALYNYGFEDTYSRGQVNFYVPWNILLGKLKTYITNNRGTLILNSHVSNLDKDHKSVTLDCDDKKIFYDKLIVAIPPASIPLQFSQIVNTDFRHIKHQPFAYIFAVIKNHAFSERFKSYTVVPRPLQKVIPINADKHVFMIAYADNICADYLKEYVKSCSDVQYLIKQYLDMCVTVSDYKLVYQPIGTHYRTNHLLYKPSPILKGEAFALNQGWTNGAL